MSSGRHASATAINTISQLLSPSFEMHPSTNCLSGASPMGFHHILPYNPQSNDRAVLSRIGHEQSGNAPQQWKVGNGMLNSGKRNHVAYKKKEKLYHCCCIGIWCKRPRAGYFSVTGNADIEELPSVCNLEIDVWKLCTNVKGKKLSYFISHYYLLLLIN